MPSILKKNVINPKYRSRMWILTVALCVAPALFNASDFKNLLKTERSLKFFDQAGVVSCVYRDVPYRNWVCRNDSGGNLVDIIPFDKKTWVYNDVGHEYFVERSGGPDGIIYTFRDDVEKIFIKATVN